MTDKMVKFGRTVGRVFAAVSRKGLMALAMAVCAFAGAASAAEIFTADPSSVTVAVGETVSVTLTSLSTKDNIDLSMGSADRNGQVTSRDFGSFTASYPGGSRTLPKGGTLALSITGTAAATEPQTLTFLLE